MARRTVAEATAGNAAHAGEVVPNARAAAVFLHVDDLRPNPRNPRMHGPEVLKLVHPDVTSLVWKFNRHHHHVDYKRFKHPLLRKPDAEMRSPTAAALVLVKRAS